MTAYMHVTKKAMDTLLSTGMIEEARAVIRILRDQRRRRGCTENADKSQGEE
jgi:hypothetical protein